MSKNSEARPRPGTQTSSIILTQAIIDINNSEIVEPRC